jgi:hypothetical protein
MISYGRKHLIFQRANLNTVGQATQVPRMRATLAGSVDRQLQM